MRSSLVTVTYNDISKHIVRIAEATYHWLCYMHTSSDSNILAESSIRYPFVECLERKGYNNIHLEAFHPELGNRRMDVFCGNVTKDTYRGILDDETVLYAEFKFVKSYTRDTNEQQRIFNDIMRLYALKSKSPDTNCYFIICGDTLTFNSCFKYIRETKSSKMLLKGMAKNDKGKRNKPTGVYADFFSFNEDDGPKKFTKSNPRYKKFCEDYHYNKIKQNASIKTRLISIFPHENHLQSPVTLAIWEVLTNE